MKFQDDIIAKVRGDSEQKIKKEYKKSKVEGVASDRAKTVHFNSRKAKSVVQMMLRWRMR